MPETIGEAFVSIRPDTTGFATETKKGVTGALSPVAKELGGLLGTAVIVKGVKDVLTAASDLNETISKTKVVFGSAAAEALKFGDNSVKALGQSKNQALGALSTFGNLFVSMGIGEQKALGLSKGIVTLATDLASFNNTSVDDALEALRSGLVGEQEPLRRFGVNVNEATIQAKALELGLGDGKTQLDASSKAQAVYALILEQTTTAQGDFARTAGGAANQQKILKAEMDNLAASAGSLLLPLEVGIVKALGTVISTTKDAVDALGGFEAVAPGVAFAIGLIGFAFSTSLGVIGLFAFAVSGIATLLGTLGGEAEDNSDKIGDLADQISHVDSVGAVKALNDFAQAGDGIQKRLGPAGKELGAFIRLAEASPASAQKYIDGVRAMGGETSTLETVLGRAITKKKADVVATEEQDTANKNLLKSTQDIHDQVLALVGGQIGYQQALVNVEKAQQAYNGALVIYGENSTEARDALLDLQSSQVAAASAANDLDKDTQELNDTFGNSRDKIQEQIDGYEFLKLIHPELASSYDPIIHKLYEMIFAIGLIPPERNVVIDAILTPAAQSILGALAGSGDPSAPFFLAAGGSNPGGDFERALGAAGINRELFGFADGGTIPGPLGAPLMVLAHGGETVRNPGQEAALSGGPSITNHFHISANTDDPVRLAVDAANHQKIAMSVAGF